MTNEAERGRCAQVERESLTSRFEREYLHRRVINLIWDFRRRAVSRAKGKEQFRVTLCVGWFYIGHPALSGSTKEYLDFNPIFSELLLRDNTNGISRSSPDDIHV